MKTVILIALVLGFNYAMADDETQAAVAIVQEQMKSPKFHKEAAKTSPEAAQVEKQIKEMSGSPANEQEIYNLASDILGNMKDKTPDEMKKDLQESSKNPEEFANSWTPEQRRKLEELAKRLPASQQRNP